MLPVSKLTLLLLIFLGGFGLNTSCIRKPEKSTHQVDLSELPVSFPVQSPEIAEFFNQIARPQDIASFPPGYIQLSSMVTAGRKMASFPAWAAAETELVALDTEIEWVLYNPEHWQNTPVKEQERLISGVQEAEKVLQARGLGFFLAPDRKFVNERLMDLAPSADALLLQGQRLQHDPLLFASWMKEKIEITRLANPEILIFVQVGATLGTPEQMLVAVQSVAEDIDGIAVWSTPRSLETLQAFIELLRREDGENSSQ